MSGLADASSLPASPPRPRPTSTLLAAALGSALLLALPLFAGSYAISIATAALYLAFVGQAWNVMMGFAGQLSLGHALYVGIGAYVAGGLFFHYGLSPWIGMWAAIAACVAVGVLIGLVAFRFGISGVYFALLTIAASEFTRVAFDHTDWAGGPAGMFLKVAQRDTVDLVDLRGPPAMYYYAALVLAALGLWLCRALLRSRAGYYWRAIREDERAAEALGIHTFRYKLLAISVSAAMTGVGGVFVAFHTNSLFPEQTFSMGRSLEIMLVPIIGGLGTLGGPLVGALVLTALGEGTTEVLGLLGVELPGMKQVVYGSLLLLTVSFLPQGIWPALWRDRAEAGGSPGTRPKET